MNLIFFLVFDVDVEKSKILLERDENSNGSVAEIKLGQKVHNCNVMKPLDDSFYSLVCHSSESGDRSITSHLALFLRKLQIL